MKFLVASENGKLSYVKAARGCDAMDKASVPAEVTTIYSNATSGRIKCMAKLSFPSETRGDVEAVAIACKDGTVRILDVENGEMLATIAAPKELPDMSMTPSEFVSLDIQHGYIATCTSGGYARFTKISSLWAHEELTCDVKLTAPIDIMRLHPSEIGTIAFGGRENDLQIWSTKIDEHEQVESQPFANLIPRWIARNVKNDKLDLRVPIWITDLQFLYSPTESAYKVITSTRHKQMRVYETAVARRPVASIEVAENGISRLVNVTSVEDEQKSKVAFADSIGNVTHVDVEKGTIIGSYKGFSGAVGSLALSDDGTVLAAGGMDSYLRAFSTNGHQQLISVYIGNRINHVLILEEEPEIKEEDALDDEDEDVWDALEEVSEPRHKKTRHA